ncbi:Glycogen synthase (plasmid) [Lactiplantibacillus plantarum]|nr:Glycogen synthase [Lactiplantibacillus plantarum]
MISRLTSQKGAQLLVATLDDFLVRHDAQVVVLGTGDPDFEQQLRDFRSAIPDNVQCASLSMKRWRNRSMLVATTF